MIILDSSAAVDIARETEDGKALAALMLTGETVISSELFYAEVANSFSKYCRAGFFSEKEAKERMVKALQLVEVFCPLEESFAEAFSESIRLEHSVYDIVYLVLARRNGATLFTLDRKLQKLCLDNGVNCVFTDTEF